MINLINIGYIFIDNFMHVIIVIFLCQLFLDREILVKIVHNFQYVGVLEIMKQRRLRLL